MDAFARIVVGNDGTEWGLEALRQALALARTENSAIHAVTALDTRPAAHAGFEAARWAEILTEEAERARETAASILARRSGSSARIVRAQAVAALRDARGELDATLLALGGRRSSRFLGIMLGDTGTELLHDGACSVLVARPRADGAWAPDTVVVGVDGSDGSLAALDVADDLADRAGATVEVVSARDGSARGDAPWTERVGSWPDAHPVAALVECSRRSDLVVVGSRGLHGVRALGSVSERVAHQAHCSVLVVHDDGSEAR